MKKMLRFFLLMTAVLLAAALTASAVSAPVLGRVYSAGKNLLFSTDNVTLNGTADFMLDGVRFKGVKAKYMQDGYNSYWDYKLLTPRLEEAGVECSVIYGSLPPEIRRRQMHLFTEGKTRVVVSTDAIGMGLNLPVRRIVFLQCSKFDGTQQRLLTTSEIRQIAGRAGRYGIYDIGYVTASDEDSLEYLRATYNRHDPELAHVSLGFPQVLLDINEPLDEILKVWHAQVPIEPFEKENVDEALFLYEKARAVREKIPGFEDKRLLYKMISTPVDIKDRYVVGLWLDYCMDYMADVTLEKPRLARGEKNGLQKYETYYKQLDLYYQMSHRLGKNIDERWIARERAKTEDHIMRLLLKEKSLYIKRCRYCGRTLPIDSPFSCCERCFQRAW